MHGGLQMSQKETLYQRQQMYDNMRIHGIKAQIESIGNTYNETYDFYNDIEDPKKSFDDRIDTWITYEEVPTIKTLRSLGWYIETEEFPVIAYIPVTYIKHDGQLASFKPCVDDKVILIANPIDDNACKREFLIKDFKGNGFPNVIYYTVKMVPFRSKISPDIEDDVTVEVPNPDYEIPQEGDDFYS